MRPRKKEPSCSPAELADCKLLPVRLSAAVGVDERRGAQVEEHRYKETEQRTDKVLPVVVVVERLEEQELPVDTEVAAAGKEQLVVVEEEVVGTEVVGIEVVEEVVAVVGIGPVEALDCTPAGFAERELKRNH